MKFLLKCLGIFLIVYLVLNWVIFLLDDGHIVNYNVGNYSVKEILDKDVMVKKVPCHNDSLCENWIYGEEKLWLIDWEYAG